MVQITSEQVAYGWQEILRQEEMQRQLLEEEDPCHKVQQVQKQADPAATNESKSQQPAPTLGTQQKKRSSTTKKKKEGVKELQQPSQQFIPTSPPEPEQTLTPTPDMDDGEPDRL